ncbi:hypothetical protein J3R83DRAFT_1966 [Lanmaoa asiatica]|nr:hypothetical protein J3R83DRAFT_1966 [Lanmaoa asiatica]
MLSVPEVIDALRAALHKKGVENHVQDAFNHIASCLVLLNSSSPSVQMIRKLCTVLRQPLLPLYNACLEPALQLSSIVLSTVLGKLCDAHNVEDEKLRAAWDATAEVILSGILEPGHIEADGAAWEVLYRIICEFFFPDSGRGLPVSSLPLCLSAYNTLTEAAARQITIRNALCQSTVLGGLCWCSWPFIQDYLLLEALLMLFARLLPPIHNTSQGKSRRVKFVKEVLGSQKLFKCSAELLDIMQKTSGTQWDDVAAQMLDALARSDITYPQPFSIDEIDVCGRVFPQPLATDRLIMDKQAFLANIVVENDDICESLQVPYSHIRTITLDNSEQNVLKGKVLIMVHLTSPPLVANVEMKPPGGSHLHAKFMLQGDTVSRFMEALRRRGVGKLSFLNPLTRVQRKRKSISIGSGFKFADDSSPIPPTASFEGKVQHVNQVYKTDIEDSTTSEAVPLPHFGDAGSSPMPDPEPVFKDESLVPEVLESAVAEKDPAIIKSARLIPSTNQTSKPVRNFTLPSSPGNSTRATQLFGDGDEHSEISEFEPDNDTAGASTSRNHESKPTQRKIVRMRVKGSSSVTSAMGIKKSSSEFVSKTRDRTEGLTQRLPETGKPLFTSDSPIFGSSSSTQIGVSPKSLSNVDTLPTISAGVDDGLSVVSRDFIGPDRLEKLRVNECGPSDTELIIASAIKPQTGVSFAEDELVPHTRRPTPSSIANQKVDSRFEITKDTNVPPKIAGSRRKREIIKSSDKTIIEVDDESIPPCKKSRDDRFGIEENKVKSNETSLAAPSIFRVKGYAKRVKGPSLGIDPMTVDFDELPELKSTRQGTRRSSRIKKRQAVVTSGTRASAMRSKTRKGKPADGQPTYSMERNELATVPLQDTGIEISRSTPSIPSSRLVPTLIRESPFPKINSHVHLVDRRSAESITPEMSSAREMLKASNILPCEPSQPAKAPWGGLGFLQQASQDAIQLVEEHSHIKTEYPIDDQHLVSDFRAVDNDVGRVQEVDEYPVSPKESEDPVGTSRPIIESTLRTKTVTIDLTIDNSPAREKSGIHKTSIDLVRPEADTQTKFRTSDRSDCIAMEEPASIPSPRHRRRSVTFASPIEYVLDKKVKYTTQANSSRSPSPSKSNTLSPLRITTGTVNIRCDSPDRIAPRATLQESKFLQVHNQIPDEVGIQDIVEVLNEIQTVIIRGISNKFRNVKKDVQHSRDELIQQVLDELQGMVVENAKYFSGLVRLEEDYYRNGKAITRCWEELIDCNDEYIREDISEVSSTLATGLSLPSRECLIIEPTYNDSVETEWDGMELCYARELTKLLCDLNIGTDSTFQLAIAGSD